MQKTLFLTGVTGEIGQALYEKFAEKGYQIIAPTRSEMDLEKSEHIERFLDSIKQPVDVFIHCAGFNEPKTIAHIAREDIEKTMQINALSFYDMSHYLVKNKKMSANGHILGVSSIYGFLARPGRFSYSVSKHCLNGMIKTLALELGSVNIKVNTIAPGFVDTKMTSKNNSPEKIAILKQKIPLARLASTIDIANVAYFLCSPENQYLTGQEIIVDGGYSIGGFES